MERLDEGVFKWAALAATIAVLEFVGEESLTNSFDRAMKHPKMRYVALGALGITGAHLLGVLPKEIDPYYYIADRFVKNGSTE